MCHFSIFYQLTYALHMTVSWQWRQLEKCWSKKVLTYVFGSIHSEWICLLYFYLNSQLSKSLLTFFRFYIKESCIFLSVVFYTIQKSSGKQHWENGDRWSCSEIHKVHVGAGLRIRENSCLVGSRWLVGVSLRPGRDLAEKLKKGSSVWGEIIVWTPPAGMGLKVLCHAGLYNRTQTFNKLHVDVK